MSEVQEIPLADLHFDPENPRLPQSLHGAEDSEVIEYLLLHANLIELMLSIGENAYFRGEPILVIPKPAGGFTVVEGNRRLGALKLLQGGVAAPVKPREVQQARDAAKHTPDVVPAIVFDTRDAILNYLGYRHITGVQQWGSLAKARYLRQLREAHAGLTDDEANRALAKTIGSKSSYVARLLTGLSLLEVARDTGVLARIGRTEEDIEFSLLTTGIGWESIQSFIGLQGITDVRHPTLNAAQFEEFFRWVFEQRGDAGTRLGESRNFPKLARVVANARALNALRTGEPLEAADLYTSGPLESFRNFVAQTETNLRAAQDTLNYVSGLEKIDEEAADRISRAGRSLSASVQAAVKAVEDDTDADS